MPRIRLAYWHGDKQPGDEIEVTGDELAGLHRDGRVAEVLEAPQAAPEPEPAPSAPEPAEEAAPSGRKRR